jgi:hypothetical protein
MHVHVEIEGGAEPLQDRDASAAAIAHALEPGTTTEITKDRAHVDADDRATHHVIPRQHISQPRGRLNTHCRTGTRGKR